MPPAFPSSAQPANASRAWKSPRRVFVLMVLWTAFVAFALWWLLRPEANAAAPGTWVMHRGDAAAQSFAERVRDWFRLADLNFQRIYPWILFGPYVGWLAWHYSLERGRLRWSLPVHLGACALFVFASYAINSRDSMRVARVVIITSHQDREFTSGEKTNGLRVELSERSSGTMDGETFTGGLFARRSDEEPLPDVLALNPDKLANAAYTNFFFKHGRGLQPPVGPPELPTMRPLTTLLDILAYGAIAGLAHSVHFYRRYREREHQTLFLESNLAKARLGALQAQLHPHFLFNSLNAIAALLRRDPKLAEATLTSLSDLLRLTLSQSEKQEVPLREELNFIERYMEIQQTRFGEKLRFAQEVDPAAMDCLVPTLLLQPLVENALRHGIEPAESNGMVRLVARRKNQCLEIFVEDDGVGLQDGGFKTGTGIGLSNLRSRLQALYGDQQRLELKARPTRGASVQIEIPCRPEGEAAGPAATLAI